MKNYIYLLCHHIDDNAQKFPGKTALIENDTTLSWSEYSAASSFYAKKLNEMFKPKSKVFFLVEKNITGYIALAAAMKAGITYVPISPSLPEERYRLLCGALKPDGIIAAHQFVSVCDKFDYFTAENRFEMPQNLTQEALSFKSSSWHPVPITEKEIAYIMFTSGTTGLPKGVMITHRAMLQYAQWAAAHSHADENDVVFGHTPLNFDVSVYAFGASIASGAALLTIASHQENNVAYMASAMEKSNASIWISAPSLLTMFIKYNWMDKLTLPRLRVVSYVGEELPNKTLIQWMQKFPNTEFHNLYGPTETTVTNIGHFYKKTPEQHDPVPIGIPHENNLVFIVDEDNRIINEPRVNGEIIIHSPGVSVGYFGDPEKTGEKFVSLGTDSSFQTCYRTGDLAYLDEEGTIFLIGRKDNQVKIRGHRIELGEIEFTLNQYPGVSQSAVAAVFSKKMDEKTIIAHVESQLEIKEHELRFFCSQKLPSYMIPFKILVLGDFPKGISGKIDRQFLAKEAEKLL
jgi:amino acid adenylation domain-containing protein